MATASFHQLQTRYLLYMSIIRHRGARLKNQIKAFEGEITGNPNLSTIYVPFIEVESMHNKY